MRKVLLLSLLAFASCEPKKAVKEEQSIALDMAQAQKIFELPVHCLTVAYPNKLGQTIGSAADLKTPQQLRPVFYGCFDWHSSVHGYWSVIELMKAFPALDKEGAVRKLINEQLTPENIAVELSFFEDANNKNFERTYGWAWLFKLQEALQTWDDADAQRWSKTLQPLTDLLIERYEVYLPKLNYPIRTGTHDNTAFGLSLSLDYARTAKKKHFEDLIITHATRLYAKDKGCNLAFEPSGHDFLSPCLEEALLMSKIMEAKVYEKWLSEFLPALMQSDFDMEVGIVSDRTDGHLVHLDGLNFSRAAALYTISRKLPALTYLRPIADKHLSYSLKHITNDDYMGSHWLGTFALYALDAKHVK